MDNWVDYYDSNESTRKLSVEDDGIFDLKSLSQFPELTHLSINGLDLDLSLHLPFLPDTIPVLPRGLTYLDCSYNKLTVLPDLLPGLTYSKYSGNNKDYKRI